MCVYLRLFIVSGELRLRDPRSLYHVIAVSVLFSPIHCRVETSGDARRVTGSLSTSLLVLNQHTRDTQTSKLHYKNCYGKQRRQHNVFTLGLVI